eukprot:8487117-Pyramimonas_sp.AAC.1
MVEDYMGGVCVRALSAKSMGAFELQAGRRVAWALGDGDGLCVGSLVWLGSGHACVARGDAQ